MNQKQKDETYQLFANAFHEIVVPLLENTATKDDIKQITEEMATKDDIGRLENKLDKHQDRMDRHGKTLENHELRIKTIEDTSLTN